MPTKQEIAGRPRLIDAARAVPEDEMSILALIDVDNFKEINDTHGHKTGDKVLAAIERAFAAALPNGAKFLRTGGDEFGCIFPRKTPEEALLLLDRIKAALSREVIGSSPISISIGIAALPLHAETVEELLDRADDALARSKREGKGRISIFTEQKMVLKSNYYPPAQLTRLSSLAEKLGKSEAAILREALKDYMEKWKDPN